MASLGCDDELFLYKLLWALIGGLLIEYLTYGHSALSLCPGGLVFCQCGNLSGYSDNGRYKTDIVDHSVFILFDLFLEEVRNLAFLLVYNSCVNEFYCAPVTVI